MKKNLIKLYFLEKSPNPEPRTTNSHYQQCERWTVSWAITKRAPIKPCASLATKD